MRPPSPMCTKAAWMQLSGPTALTSNTCRTSSARTSAILPESPSPALLTSTSRDPNSPTARATIASTEPLSETSVSTASARPPEAEISRRRVSSLSAALEASTTEAPRNASSLAVAAPIPLEAPVTTATLPLRVCSTERLIWGERGASRAPGSSPGRAPRREHGGVPVAQGDVVELVEYLHDLLFATLLAGGQPLGPLQVLQPAQAPHLADHYTPSFRFWRDIFPEAFLLGSSRSSTERGTYSTNSERHSHPYLQKAAKPGQELAGDGRRRGPVGRFHHRGEAERPGPSGRKHAPTNTGVVPASIVPHRTL